MTDLEKYEKVNKSETLQDLANTIESFAREDGKIQGRTRQFNASHMMACCLNFKNLPPEYLTREFGIRQQAMMIAYYMN